MNFLILGDGPEEWAWASAIAEHPDHALWAACPGFKALPDLPGGVDLDGALAFAGVQAVVVGGEYEVRAEGLRRAASAGLPVICLHPPGLNADPYYQVALSRQETGSWVVPDTPARLHPGVAELRQNLAKGTLGAFREIRYEASVRQTDGDLTAEVFPRAVDVVRSLLGEVEAVTATGDPPGVGPTDGLVVQLRGSNGRRAEVRLRVGAPEPVRLTLAGADGSLILEYDPDFLGTATLTRRTGEGPPTVVELEPWDPKGALLLVLTESIAGHARHPDLTDGTRAVELAEATARGLRRGRTIDLHYEEMTEAGNFKSVMTSAGCFVLFATLLALPVALAGPAFGHPWTLYIAYAMPFVMVLFVLMQLFRFALKKKA